MKQIKYLLLILAFFADSKPEPLKPIELPYEKVYVHRQGSVAMCYVKAYFYADATVQKLDNTIYCSNIPSREPIQVIITDNKIIHWKW